LELRLRLPAEATAELSVDFDKAFLHIDDHPPDANRGLEVASPVVQIACHDGGTATIYPGAQLLRVATPDFSASPHATATNGAAGMPYNVITLSCTVLALFFGSIFNATTRKLPEFAGGDPVPPSFFKRIGSTIWSRLNRKSGEGS